jgi:hypothetical protein
MPIPALVGFSDPHDSWSRKTLSFIISSAYTKSFSLLQGDFPGGTGKKYGQQVILCEIDLAAARARSFSSSPGASCRRKEAYFALVLSIAIEPLQLAPSSIIICVAVEFPIPEPFFLPDKAVHHDVVEQHDVPLRA